MNFLATISNINFFLLWIEISQEILQGSYCKLKYAGNIKKGYLKF